ncbi:MAG: Ger(x)C family spore germination protein [Thermoclostridium sp.]|nr:Ger(x)C family spore germination protein [Thermoclostridium sp.]
MNCPKRAIKLNILVMLCLCLFFTSGCYDAIEVDELVYVVAMGLDGGIDGNVRMSMLLAVPIAVGVGPEPGEVEKSATMLTVEAPTIYGGMSIANSILSKKVNFSHTKLVVISKKLAEKGIEKYMNTFNRFREFRPDTYLGVARDSAEDFLRESKPILEANPAKYYELLMESWKTTGFSVDSRLSSFYRDMRSNDGQAVAALLDVNRLKTSEEFEQILFSGNDSNLGKVMEGDYTAGQVPAIFDTKSMNMGMAVFKADKMVGELKGRETVFFLMITGKLEEAYFSIPTPEEQASTGAKETDFVSLKLSLGRKPVVQVKMNEDTPYITAHIFLEGSVLTMEGDKDYSTGEGLKRLEDFSAEYIRGDVLSFLEKTRDSFHSDICVTGKKIKQQFLVWDDWVRFGWNKKYENASFDVILKVAIRRTGMTVKQIPMSDLKGNE